MKKTTLLCLLLLIAAAPSRAAAPDKKGCKGDSLFSRMPGTFVKDCLNSDFASMRFEVTRPPCGGESAAD